MCNLKSLSIKLNGKIQPQNLLNINFDEISTRELVVKNYRGFRIIIDEFGDILQIGIDVESNLMFSINKPEKIFKMNELTYSSNFPYEIYIIDNQYNPFLIKNFENFWKPFSENINGINLSKLESVFIDGYRFCLILKSNRNIISILDDVINLIKKSDLFFINEREKRIYKKNIPDVLKPLFPLLKRWAISDDQLREELIEQTSKYKKEKLIKTVDPFMQSINEYLDSFKKKPFTEEAIKISNLAELVSEMKIT